MARNQAQVSGQGSSSLAPEIGSEQQAEIRPDSGNDMRNSGASFCATDVASSGQLAGNSEVSSEQRQAAEEPTKKPDLPSLDEASKEADRSNVVKFPVPKKNKLRTGAPAKPKIQKQKASAKLRASAQSDESETLKGMFPTPPSGWWWVVDADATGFKIKLRWREGVPPHSVVFPRLGKNEFKTLMEVNSEDRQWLIADRIHADLAAKGRRDVAHRLGLESGDHRQSLAAG